MFTQRQMETLFLSAVAVLLLLSTAGQSAVLTTASPPPATSSPTTQINNSSSEGPYVLRSHVSCGSEHDAFCANGGTCIYPQDSEKPSCICVPPYGGERCMLFTDSVSSLPEGDVIGITVGITMLVILLAITIYCCASKRCVKSTPLIKSAPSETSV
ncbi:epigen [Salarias fasciatus]|uniref:Epigen-like n=1 Tax=Salarias fasciatus TaxID=181472 RepID=A0A672H5H1_SALFA|nr:epigen-like [Salarias fasciatus]